MADGRFPDKSAMDILKSVQQMTEPVQCICRWWCILAQPSEYDWTSVCCIGATLCQVTL